VLVFRPLEDEKEYKEYKELDEEIPLETFKPNELNIHASFKFCTPSQTNNCYLTIFL
jgi:hypothetical protein